MPLSGTLKELPFPELLRLLRDQTGNLQILDKTAGDHFSFGFSAGKLVSAFESGLPIPDALALHAVIRRLSDNESAAFDFEEARAGEPPGPLSIPVDRILLSALAAIASPERYAHYFPHPGTRFRAGAEVMPWLTEDLLAFWVGAERLFRSGTSGDEIAEALGLPLRQVLLDLFKLRLLGVIVPVRAVPPPAAAGSPERALPASEPLPVPADPLPAEVTPAPVRELVPPPCPPPAPAASPPHPAQTPEISQQPKAPRQGLLARMAAGLRKILEKMYE